MRNVFGKRGWGFEKKRQGFEKRGWGYEKKRQGFEKSDGATMQQVRGKVGGAVQLTCKIDSTQLKAVYFMRKNLSGEYQIFVNGFYSGQSVDVSMLPEYKHRTSFNRTALSLDFWNLTISDEGDYACYVVPHNLNPWIATQFHLTVTADYSVPIITVQECSDRGEGQLTCVLSCSSSGGYPWAAPTWTVLEDHDDLLLQDEGTSGEANKHTGVWSISQSISLICTQPSKLSCSVGGVTSPLFSVCEKDWAKYVSFLLYNIRRIRPFLSQEAAQLLVQSLVISRLDYPNSLLAGLPLGAIRPCHCSRMQQLDSSSVFPSSPTSLHCCAPFTGFL
ncbi:hypothetical protein NFI96_001319 [Prochilodus magdalenae]|nr:hypothetical protein NFI96_001319 [Prochilodus magdalenae]